MNYRELKAIFRAQEERNKKDGADGWIVERCYLPEKEVK